jgi:hypothetical protein
MAEHIAPPASAKSCEACFATNACTPEKGCGSSEDCDAYVRCFVACPTPDCREACAAAHPSGAASYAPLQQVYASSCAKDCAYGSNWACVGHIEWPALKSRTITQSGRVLDYSTGLPVAGVNVCFSAYCATCGSEGPSAMAQTDADGGVTVTLQLGPGQAFGGTNTGFQGCTALSGPGIAPAWGNSGFPQSESHWTIEPVYGMLINTPAELAMNCGAIGLTCDPARSVVSMRVVDCMGNPAPDVQVALDHTDPSTTLYYGGGDAGTSSTGLAFFINVPAPATSPPLNVTMTATPVALGRPASTQTFGIQAGINTQVEVCPTP